MIEQVLREKEALVAHTSTHTHTFIHTQYEGVNFRFRNTSLSSKFFHHFHPAFEFLKYTHSHIHLHTYRNEKFEF